MAQSWNPLVYWRDLNVVERIAIILFLIAVLAILFISPAWAQGGTYTPQSTGPAVDARGSPVVDPTKNVLDLVQAAIKRIDDILTAVVQRQDDLRGLEVRRLNELRDAETRRINELQAQKQVFDLELARVIRSNVDSSTLLLATQLKEVKLDLSDRVGKMEQFANEQRGRATAGGESTTLIIAVIMGSIALGALVVAIWRRSPHLPHQG